MMFADAERVEPHLIGMDDLFHQVAYAIRITFRAAGLAECGRKAIDTYLHHTSPFIRRGYRGTGSVTVF